MPQDYSMPPPDSLWPPALWPLFVRAMAVYELAPKGRPSPTLAADAVFDSPIEAAALAKDYKLVMRVYTEDYPDAKNNPYATILVLETMYAACGAAGELICPVTSAASELALSLLEAQACYLLGIHRQKNTVPTKAKFTDLPVELRRIISPESERDLGATGAPLLAHRILKVAVTHSDYEKPIMADVSESEKFLTEREAASRLNVCHRTLQIWRSKGVGPVFVKLGGAVRYRASDLAMFIANGVRGVPAT